MQLISFVRVGKLVYMRPSCDYLQYNLCSRQHLKIHLSSTVMLPK